MTVEKLCKKCLQTKPIGEFYRHSRMADGHLNKCKECAKADVTENRNANLEYYRQYDLQRYDASGKRPQRLVGKRCHIESCRRWYTKNVEKKRANTILARAIKAGKVRRPTICEHCGNDGRIEGHHADYAKPLDVEWLCTVCHGETRTKPRIAMKPRKRGGYVGSMLPTRA